jgi:hypothetical protein
LKHKNHHGFRNSVSNECCEALYEGAGPLHLGHGSRRFDQEQSNESALNLEVVLLPYLAAMARSRTFYLTGLSVSQVDCAISFTVSCADPLWRATLSLVIPFLSSSDVVFEDQLLAGPSCYDALFHIDRLDE